MVFTENDLQERLLALRQQGKKALETLDLEFEEHFNWLQAVRDGIKNGTTLNVKSVLVPKTPGKSKQPLTAIRESFETTIDLEDESTIRASTRGAKKGNKKGATKKATSKTKKIYVLQEDDEDVLPVRAQKRLSEDTIDSTSKRLCGNRTSETTSRDSGLSSVGSRNLRDSTIGTTVKQEIVTPKNTSLASNASAFKDDDSISDNTSIDTTTVLSTEPPEIASPPKKRSRSAGRGTFVVKQERRSSSRCHSEPRTPDAKKSSVGNNRTLIVAPAENFESPIKSPLRLAPQAKNQANVLRSPIMKAPAAHNLKGECVKKAVRAYEALSDTDSEHANAGIAMSSMLPPSKPVPQSKLTPPAVSVSASSLDDAVNAPPRVTRTKTRAMAKAAAVADEERKANKVDPTISSVSKILKSPIRQQQVPKIAPSKSGEGKLDDHQGKENTTFTASKLVMKPFGSASKQPQLFLKTTTPLNRLTPSHSANTSLNAPRLNNLVTTVDSFLVKPVVIQEVKPSREENLQKLVARADVASKKRDEIIKAQMEEKIKKREEKRLKVCAAREAMEKEKFEMQQRLEREREQKQQQLQAERKEKIRQENLKKIRLAQAKAAETEERRRQEEVARLAKLKQQEEEQRRIAAQRRKEQEEAERKQMERLQQEREAAAYRAKEAERQAKEAERLAKEATLKAKKTSKVQLDQTYDMLPPASQSYGITPSPEERQPLPMSNPDNYGIDDANTDDSSEDEAKPKKVVPHWAQTKQRIPKLLDDYEITHSQMFAFFESKKSTPDLSKIFVAIDRRQLIRKSSAVWRTPPVKC